MTLVKIDASKSVSVPDEEASLVVDLHDWARVRGDMERAGDPPTEYAVNGSLALGGAVVTLLGVAVGLEHATPAASTNLLTGLWVAFGLCTLFGVVLHLVGRRERVRYRVSHLSVCGDMDSIAARAGHPALGAIPFKPRMGLKRWLKRLWLGELDEPGTVE